MDERAVKTDELVSLDEVIADLEKEKERGEKRVVLEEGPKESGELSSNSEDNLVWGCPSAFSRTGQGKIVLSDFSKLIYQIIRKTRL